MLTVRLGARGTFVLNKQAPNRQLWLSSPLSGPARYNLGPGGRWLGARGGGDLLDRLAAELRELTAGAVGEAELAPAAAAADAELRRSKAAG